MIRVPEPTIHSTRPYTKAMWRRDVGRDRDGSFSNWFMARLDPFAVISAMRELRPHIDFNETAMMAQLLRIV